MILLLHPEQGTTRGDNCGAFPAHPNQGYKSQMAHTPREGMAAGMLYTEGALMLPSQMFFLESILSPPWAQLGQFVPAVPNLSAGPGEHGRGFLSNPNHPRTCSSSSPSLRQFRQEMTGIPVLQEPLFSRNSSSPYPKSIQHTQGPAQDINMSHAARNQLESWCFAAEQRPCLDFSAKFKFPAG